MSTTESHYQLDTWRFKLDAKNLKISHTADHDHKPVEMPWESLRIKYFQNRKLTEQKLTSVFFLIIMCALLLIGTVIYGYTSVVGLVPDVGLPVVPTVIAGLAVLGAVIMYLILSVKEETHQLLIESDTLHGKVSWSYTTTQSDKRLRTLFQALSEKR